MTNETINAEITRMRELAEEGRNAPLTGGNIGLWWGGLTSLMLLTHWATVTDRMPWPIQYIGLGWIAYMVIGNIGTAILVKKINRNPDSNALSNQVASAAWMMAMIAMLTFVIGVAIAVFFNGVPSWLFNAILPVSFICYGLAYGITAKLAKDRPSGIAAITSFVVALIMIPFLLQSVLYLFAAFSVLVVTFIPTLLHRRAG